MGYDRGWHLRGTPLWFDAERRRELCLLTGVEARPPPLHQRVVASAPLARALGRLGYGAPVLPTPWQRPLGMGGARIQLFDAHGQAGAAVAWVEATHASHLVGGLLRMAPLSTPPAQHFVARLPAVGHRGAPMRDVAIALATAITNLRSGTGAVRVWADHPEVGLGLIEEMSVLKHPLRARGALAKWADPTTEPPGAGTTVAAVALVPHLETARTAPRTADDDVNIVIDSGIGGGRGVLLGRGMKGPVFATLAVGYFADVGALRAAVVHTQARSVLLADVPAAAESRIRQALASLVQVKFLSDAQQLPLAQ